MVWPPPSIEGCVFFVDLDLFVERNKAIGTGGKFVVLKK